MIKKSISLLVSALLFANTIACTNVFADDNKNVASTYTNSMSTAKNIKLNETNKFLPEMFEEYWVKFKVPKQGYITIKCNKFNGNDGKPVEMIFELKDSKSQPIKEIYADGDNLSKQYTYKIGLKPGEYYLNLQPGFFYDINPSYINYKIEFKETPNFEIESNDSKLSATPIKLNTPISGVMEDVLDDDYFKITVNKDTKVKFKVKRKFNETPANNVYSYEIYYGNGKSDYISEDYMQVGKDHLYQYITLKKGTNYISTVTTADLVDYTISLETGKAFKTKLTTNEVKATSKTITGKGEKAATVKAYVGKKEIGKATVDKNGKYSIKIKPQKKDTKITVKMSKSGYNTTSKTVTVKNAKFKKALTVNSIKSSSKKVTGKGEAKATVKAYVGKKEIGKATVDKNGKYSMKIKAQKKNTKVTVKMSKSGYSTVEKSVKVKK